MIGVNLQLFDGATQQASLTGLQACWWDVLEPKDMTRPVGKATGISTDATGFINLDLSNVSGLTIGDFGFLTVYKLDGTDHEDSLVFSGRVVTSDIVSGTDMYYYDSGWTRPSDWPALDDPATGVQKFQGLWAVYNQTEGNLIAVNAAGAYTVDWGDGSTPENIATGVTAQHSYDYTAVDLGNVTSRGYKCAVVTITPQAANNITSINLDVRHSTFTQAKTKDWLDLRINSEYLTALDLYGNSTGRLAIVEQVWIGEHNITNMSSMFRGCRSLQSVPLFNTASVTNMSSMFNDCYSLQSVPLFNTVSVTNMNSMFYACFSLQSVPLFTIRTASAVSMAFMFFDCKILKSVPLFDTQTVTNMASMLRYNEVMESVPAFNMAAVTNIASMLRDCASLRSVGPLSTAAVTTTTDAFTDSPSLQAVQMTGQLVTFSVANCSLGPVALDALYTSLGTVTAQTITVTGNWGTASHDPTIATGKGWTVEV